MQICCSTFLQWDIWLLEQRGVSFAQSMMWGRLLAEEDKEVELLQAVEGNTIYAQALVVTVRLPLGFTYLFSPKGPVVASRGEDVYRVFFDYFKERHALFWRVEPVETAFGGWRFRQTKEVNPRATTLLAIAKTPDELLAGMHQKTRYNIHLAEKKGVVVREEKNWDIFWRLMQITKERDGFRLHGEKHYEHIWGSSFSRQLTAYVAGKPVATALFAGFGDTFTYLYGASDYSYRQFMAPYLAQWEGIQLGKRLRYTQYDTFGIAPRDGAGRDSCHPEAKPKDPLNPAQGILCGVYTERSECVQNDKDEYIYDPKHQYAGVTRFKLGFGGTPVVAPGTYDLIISPWRYKLYQVLRRVRRLF
ncbi:MAG: peptidoglycan bridge formation glycyltransferase FemA/FemB family protein, partial [Candidatus Magasanikbacteria bacterium]|nr:peptidoglycan bridge formation glycyltransferase FemA/FemB family protein [Candidatus Magasanikbacteria bacterium]